jgi:hypothetical protein
MKLKLVVMTCLIALVLGTGFALIACEDQGNYRIHPLMSEDDNNYAKNMTADQNCELDDLFIEDCNDACTCCYFGQLDQKEFCVSQCDTVLLRYQSYPPAETEVDDYKECLVGCWSICDIEDKVETCWDQCNIYIQDAD